MGWVAVGGVAMGWVTEAVAGERACWVCMAAVARAIGVVVRVAAMAGVATAEEDSAAAGLERVVAARARVAVATATAAAG